MADREPHPCAFRFGSEEWFEDAICLLGLDSRARILNLDQDLVCVPCRPDHKHPWYSLGSSHGFNGIDDEVNQYLLQLHLVAVYSRQIRSKVGAQGDLVPVQLVAQDRGYVPNDLVDV